MKHLKPFSLNENESRGPINGFLEVLNNTPEGKDLLQFVFPEAPNKSDRIYFYPKDKREIMLSKTYTKLTDEGWGIYSISQGVHYLYGNFETPVECIKNLWAKIISSNLGGLVKKKEIPALVLDPQFPLAGQAKSIGEIREYFLKVTEKPLSTEDSILRDKIQESIRRISQFLDYASFYVNDGLIEAAIIGEREVRITNKGNTYKKIPTDKIGVVKGLFKAWEYFIIDLFCGAIHFDQNVILNDSKYPQKAKTLIKQRKITIETSVADLLKLLLDNPINVESLPLVECNPMTGGYFGKINKKNILNKGDYPFIQNIENLKPILSKFSSVFDWRGPDNFWQIGFDVNITGDGYRTIFIKPGVGKITELDYLTNIRNHYKSAMPYRFKGDFLNAAKNTSDGVLRVLLQSMGGIFEKQITQEDFIKSICNTIKSRVDKGDLDDWENIIDEINGSVPIKTKLNVDPDRVKKLAKAKKLLDRNKSIDGAAELTSWREYLEDPDE